MKERIKGKLETIFRCSYMIIAVISILLPFYIIVITAFKTNREALNPIFTWWPQEGFSLDGFKTVLFDDSSGTSMFRAFLNTLFVAIPTTIIGVLVSALAAYAYAKLEFAGKKIFFAVHMMTMLLPSVVTLTSSYLLFDAFGWVDTFLPLIIPGMFGGVSSIFFLRQFLIGVPNELIETARLDGASEYRIYASVIVPLIKPALVAQGILGFIGRYNDYLGPLLYLQSPELYTLQIALKFFVGLNVSDWPVIMAGAVIAIMPLLIIYFIAQDRIISGIQMSSGLKG